MVCQSGKKMIELLRDILEKPSRLAIGLMSGTSVDGIDAALVRITGSGRETRVETLAEKIFPFRTEIRKRIFTCFTGGAADICQMNFVLGQLFGVAAKQIVQQTGIDLSEVDFIASHGQTIYHIPGGQEMVRSTLQIGEGAVIAELTGRLTITDFRTRDIAAGGDGAPLVPYMEYLLFQEPGVHRVMVNIGGVANLTLLDEDIDRVLAFDTGPGNMLIDEVARALAPELPYDINGDLGAQGKVIPDLLDELLNHPYFKKAPPKSTGRELFGAAFAKKLMSRYPEKAWHDLIATLTAFTARSIQQSLARFVLPWSPVEEIVFSGGGVHNATLMQMMHGACPGIRMRTSDEFGIGVDSKEAIAFTVLGNETLHGNAGNVPRATGASRRAILGKISLP